MPGMGWRRSTHFVEWSLVLTLNGSPDLSTTSGGHFRRPDPANQHTRRSSPDRAGSFAGADDDVTDIDPERIRILSSLDRQQRRASGSGNAGGTRPPQRAGTQRWWSHVLLGLMGMGLFTVALAVFLIFKSSRDSEWQLTRWDVGLPPSVVATADPDLLINSQPPGAGPLSAEVAQAETFGLLHDGQTEVDLATDPAARTDAVSMMSAPPASMPTAEPAASPPPSQASPRVTASSDERAAAPSSASIKAAAPATRAASSVVPAAPPAEQWKTAPVPLHGDPRIASPAELFKSCQGLIGAERAVCRARICVQHPGVPACQ